MTVMPKTKATESTYTKCTQNYMYVCLLTCIIRVEKSCAVPVFFPDEVQCNSFLLVNSACIAQKTLIQLNSFHTFQLNWSYFNES